MKSDEITNNQENTKKRTKKARMWELDALRGLAILLVAWDHTMYDIAYMFGFDWQYNGTATMRNAVDFAESYMTSNLRYTFWPVFVFLFFIVSGICTTFSRNNYIRGVKLALVALGLTGVTIAIEKIFDMTGVQITFGVLHCLALCILLYATFELIFKLIAKGINRKNDHTKITRWMLPAFCLLLGVALLIINHYYNTPVMEVTSLNSIPSSDCKILGLFIYIREWWANTADYFPLLPFFGLFLLGAAVAPVLYPKKKSLLPRLDGKWHYFLTIPGRYSIFVYLGSQVLAVGIIALITYIKLGYVF